MLPGVKRVFISYSSKDSVVVGRLVDELNREGIPYWKAPEMIPAGSNYAREIPKAIKECSLFVLVISNSSQDSIWVQKEIDCAINDRKLIVPLKIGSCELTDMFKFYLNNVQIISYQDDTSHALELLMRRLKAMLQRKPAQLTAPVGLGKDLSSAARKNRLNALSANPQPVFCQYCGGELYQVSRGTYKCVDCGQLNYDAYQTVRNYLDKNGPTSSVIIARDTKVPRKLIDGFLREEMLEIPKACPIRLRCEKCGAPIRTGHLCEACKGK